MTARVMSCFENDLESRTNPIKWKGTAYTPNVTFVIIILYIIVPNAFDLFFSSKDHVFEWVPCLAVSSHIWLAASLNTKLYMYHVDECQHERHCDCVVRYDATLRTNL